jgi:uncharacterized membrane protein YdbT with pleckstrin-like domain
MSAAVKREPQSMIVRLVLAVAGALLMVGTPFTFDVLNLTSRLQSTMVAAVELVFLVVGLMLLYLAFRGKESAN